MLCSVKEDKLLLIVNDVNNERGDLCGCPYPLFVIFLKQNGLTAMILGLKEVVEESIQSVFAGKIFYKKRLGGTSADI